MKLAADAPELTAYLLGELTVQERAAFEAALTGSTELRTELAGQADVVGRLTAELAAEPVVALSPGQRAAIVRQASRATAVQPRGLKGQPSRLNLWRHQLAAWKFGWTALAATACAVALALVLWPRTRTVELAFNELRYQPKAVTASAPNIKAAPTATVASELLAPTQPPMPTLAVKGAPAPSALPERGPILTLPVPGDANRIHSPLPGAPSPQLGNRAPAASPGSVRAVTGKDQPVSKGAADALGLSGYSRSARKFATGVESAGVKSRVDPDYYQLPSEQRADRGGQRSRLDREGIVAESRRGGSPELPGLEIESRALRLTESAPEKRDRSRAVPALRFAVVGPNSTVTPLAMETYEAVAENSFQEVTIAPLSTFGLDVDTASYANVRRFLRGGSLPPRDAVRIEELVNYFHYDYPPPRGDAALGATVEVATCPWNEANKLVRIGVKARAITGGERPVSNLVFLLDVSGSMEPENRLPLVKRALRLLLDRLTPRDRVGIVTYAGDAQVALEPVALGADGKRRVTEVIEGLRAGSGTRGSAGIEKAYMMATNHFVRGGVNRVILCTDGDFNLGITDRTDLFNFITREAKSGVFLSVLGFGMDNLKDATMEMLADKGNGNYAYIDSFAEARKVLGQQLDGTLVTVAKDAKVQVEFNPARVASYRLLGYEKRALRDRDFNDDTQDAGEVGAGLTVTMLYELVPAGPDLMGVDPLRYAGEPKADRVAPKLRPEAVHPDELLNLKLRYQPPYGGVSRLLDQPVKAGDHEFGQAGTDFKFAAAVAGYGLLLRDSPHKGDLTWDRVLRFAEQGLGADREGYRAEFIDLVRQAQKLGGGR